MIATEGRAYDYKGGIAVKTFRPPADNLSDRVTVLWCDSRCISPEQRRKAWALIGEIAAWAGYLGAEDKRDLNATMKAEFLRARVDKLQAEAIKAFSLSDVDMTTARLYIDWLVEFCVVNSVPTKVALTEYAEDIAAYVYACLMHKRCAVCGRKADLHHVDRVGMGGDRAHMSHIGLRCLPLCREHHQEAHQHGDAALMEKYHLEPIRIDDKIARTYRLGGAAQASLEETEARKT